MAAAMLLWACSSESYPGLEYDNPNSVTNDETPDENSGLPIHVYVNEQAVVVLSSHHSSRENDDMTRGVGSFQIEEDEDIARRRNELDELKKQHEAGLLTDEEINDYLEKARIFKEDTTLMSLKKDTTTFYIFAFRNQKADVTGPETSQLKEEPNMHTYYQIEEQQNHPAYPESMHDALRLDCLIDGYDYYKGMPANLEAEQHLKMKRPEASPLYWGEYQGVGYNFFAYTVGDINKGEKADLKAGQNNIDTEENIQWGIPHRDADKIWYENFGIDGSQDLMVGCTPPLSNDLLNDRYKTVKLTDAERNRILYYGNYTSFAAHRGIEPQVDLKHLLTRLRFSMLPGDSTASYTTIDAVYATTPCKGDFIVASKDPNEIGFYPYGDQSAYGDLYLHDRPQLDEEGHLLPSKILDSAPSEDRIVEWKPEYWIKDNNGKIIGKVPLTERGEPLHLGDDLLIPPASQIVITIQSHYRRKDDFFDDDRTFRSLYTINAETLAKNEQDKSKYWDEEKQEYRFKPGYIYDITLVVYGLQKIVVTGNIEAWKEGGEVVIDPDDADDSWTINP